MLLRIFKIVIISVIICSYATAQESNDIVFLSDTQAPIWVETILLPPYRNVEATDSLFSDIIGRKPKVLFLLGDLVSVGSDINLWKDIDDNLRMLNKEHIPTFAVPGNHEYMFAASFGITNHNIRFPNLPINGYAKVIDSTAVIMLNSNFGYLTPFEINEQEDFLKQKLDEFDTSNFISDIIVACHHSPFTNSRIVNTSEEVQHHFVKPFLKSKKTKLFISGHSHNLEMFKQKDKTFLVIGGGGGLKQPLKPKGVRRWADNLDNDIKPLYFYIIIHKINGILEVTARGFKRDFKFFNLKLLEIN